MPRYPEHLRAGSGDAYELRPDLHSRQHASGTPGKDALAILPDDQAGVHAIYKGAAPRDHDAGPVYSAGMHGSLAVPTGRVLVRLRDGLDASSRRKEFAKAGYDIESTLSYAPNAAWLRPTAGGVGAALNGMPALQAVPDVVHVEPQLLSHRQFK